MLDYRMNTFLTLCEQMHYHKTAEILNMTQPSVTQHIHTLEQFYGTKLFVYDGRRLKKTEGGILLEKYAKAAMVSQQDLLLSVQLPTSTPLRIGATKTIGNFVLMPYLARYLKTEDKSTHLCVDNTVHLLTSLENGELDFAIVEGSFNKEKFDSILWRNESFVGLCSKSHPFANKIVTWDDVMREHLILREKGSGTLDILQAQLFQRGYSLGNFDKVSTINEPRLLMESVAENIGVSFGYISCSSHSNCTTFTIKNEVFVGEFRFVWLNGVERKENINHFCNSSGLFE